VYYQSVNAPVVPGSTDAVTLAQTFTAGVSGTLTDVSLYVSVLAGDGMSYPANLTVAVVGLDGSGHPEMGGTPLGSADVPVADLPGPGVTGWFDVSFLTPFAVVAGSRYAIVLGASTLGTNPWLSWEMDSSSAGAYMDYPGGEAMAASVPSGGSWTWNDLYDWVANGGTGTADMAFRTYVQAAAATPTPLIPTPPPTDTVAAGPARTDSQGWLALLATLGVIATVAIVGDRVRTAARRD
jgi:hypothetical protein